MALMALMGGQNDMLEDVELWQLTLGMNSQTSQNEADLFRGPDFHEAWRETVMAGLSPGKAYFGQWSRHRADVRAGALNIVVDGISCERRIGIALMLGCA